MSNNLNYRVFPQKASYKTVTLSESERKNVEGLNDSQSQAIGVLVFLGVAAIGYIIFGVVIGVVLGIVGAIIVRNMASSYIRENKASEIELQRIDGANERENQRVTRDAEYLTSSLIRIYDSSKTLASEVPTCLKNASLWLQAAEKEFQANAFAPFWDAVETAARCLGEYNFRANQLASNANEYYQMLNGKKHTFPVFPVRLQTIPDASFVISELHRIVRLGQTDFRFANIWEHRRTRQEIVAGFQTLNDAINNLGNTIEYSISNLQNSISSDIAKVVEEQIRTRESIDIARQSADKTRESVDKTGASIDKRLLEQNRMLDNIQHDREPKLRDIPSKH